MSDLIEEGARIAIYDPKVENSKIEDDFKKLNKINFEQCRVNWEICSSIQEAALESDAIVVLTEWEEFLYIDWKSLINSMRKPAWLFDTRSCIDHNKAKNVGFNVWEIGNSVSINKY